MFKNAPFFYKTRLFLGVLVGVVSVKVREKKPLVAGELRVFQLRWHRRGFFYVVL